MKPVSALPAVSKAPVFTAAVRRGLQGRNISLPARAIIATPSRPRYYKSLFGGFRGYATIPDKQWAQVIEKTGERTSNVVDNMTV